MMFNNENKKKMKEELIVVLDGLDPNVIRLTKSNEEFADEIINMVSFIIESYGSNGFNVEIEDIMQETYNAILEAALLDRSNVHGGFENYVRMDVKGRIESLCLNNKAQIYMPQEIKKQFRQYVNAFISLENKLERAPNVYEVASVMRMDIEEIKRLDSYYKIYKNAVNMENLDISDDNCVSIDSYNNGVKDTVLKMLNSVELLDSELAVTLLYFGIVLPNDKPIYYNGKKIMLDGTSKTLEAIAKMFGITLERCRQILGAACYKMAIDNQIIGLGVSEYAVDPNLVLRMKDIYNWIRIIPFTDKYPNFNSYFREYTDIEVESACQNISDFNRSFIEKIKKFDTDVNGFSYGLGEVKRLYSVIREIYSYLINCYGRRPMATELSDCNLSYYGHYINNMRNIYSNFDRDDRLVIDYLIIQASDYQRSLLRDIYENDLDKTLLPREIVKMDGKTIAALENVIASLKGKIKEVKKSNLLKKSISVNAGVIKACKIDDSKDNLNGIYRFLSIYPVEFVDMILNNLFLHEMAILRKVFGNDLMDNNYINNLEKLSEMELAIYNCIMVVMIKKLKIMNQAVKSKEKYNRKVFEFRSFFSYYGYEDEDIDYILNSGLGLELMREYLKYGTTKERREEIVQLIVGMLYNTFGPGMIVLESKICRIKIK